MNYPRPTDQELRGMTVNERLFVCGLLEKWDVAVRNRQREEMMAVLRQVAMTQEQIENTTDAVLKNPETYGF